MSLTQYEIYEACKRGELFTIDNVRIVSMETTCPPGCNRAQIGCVVRVGSNKESVLNDVDLDNIHIYKKTKYDPCRKFRKGDKVRLVKYKNRTPYDYEDYCMVEEESLVYTLPEDEAEDGFVYIDEEHSVCVCYLELFMPVEELEPYYVHECKSDCSFEVCCEKQGKVVCRMAYFWHSESCRGELTKEQAKAAAEAERDRLNAEHRKEMEK